MTKKQKENNEKEKPQKYSASIYTAPMSSLPSDFVVAVKELEDSLKMQIFLLIQNGVEKFGALDDMLLESFLKSLDSLPCKKPVAIMIDSAGGYANCAYKIATFFRSQCGGFVAIVPRYAKSAATLLALGSKAILLGQHAELGPLDAQFLDPERETNLSALDEVQALERLHAFALEAVDRTMYLLVNRTGKKLDTLLPMSLHFVADMVRPLFEDIDAVHYTQMSRALKVAEEYARRLLQSRYTEEKASQIARHLVEKYPEHGFVIDIMEAARIDPKFAIPLPCEYQSIVNRIIPHLTQLTAIGYLKEVNNEK